MSRSVVLGGAGFLGSHLCDRLIQRGDDVIAVDDLTSGSLRNVEHLLGLKNFEFVRSDISQEIPIQGKVDLVLNFASPASPPRYGARPIHTLRTGSAGTENALDFALKSEARFVMASTSEVYGDPMVHPQSEGYWGHVNPIGPRSCYDEAKRYAEALCMAYQRERSANVGIVRIFNTYGPRLDPSDGRVVSNFLAQAIRGTAITIYGDGSQTRSFCFVDDLIDGLMAMANSQFLGPVNLGNPTEISMIDLSALISQLLGHDVPLTFEDLPVDDPRQRCPDISLARATLGWEPKVSLVHGLGLTIDWFRRICD